MAKFYILDIDETSPAVIVAAMEAGAEDDPELVDMAQRYADQTRRQVVCASWAWVVQPTPLVVAESASEPNELPWGEPKDEDE